MEHFLTCNIPIDKLICSNCLTEQANHENRTGTQNIIFDVPVPNEKNTVPASFFNVQVDVKKIKWKHEENGVYTAIAQLSVNCPKCDKEHKIEQIIKAPLFFLEKSRKCDKCGSPLSFQEEELEIEDDNGKPLIRLIGKLICERCKSTSSICSESEAVNAKSTDNKPAYILTCGKGEEIIMKL